MAALIMQNGVSEAYKKRATNLVVRQHERIWVHLWGVLNLGVGWYWRASEACAMRFRVVGLFRVFGVCRGWAEETFSNKYMKCVGVEESGF